MTESIEQIERTWTIWQPSVISVLILAGIVLISLGLFHFLFVLFAKLTEREEFSFLNPFVRHWKHPAGTLFVLILVQLVWPLMSFPENVLQLLQQFINLGLVGILTFFTIRSLYVFRDVVVEKNKYQGVLDNLDERRLVTQINIIIKVAVVIFSIIGISLALMTFPEVRRVGISILASAG